MVLFSNPISKLLFKFLVQRASFPNPKDLNLSRTERFFSCIFLPFYGEQVKLFFEERHLSIGVDFGEVMGNILGRGHHGVATDVEWRELIRVFKFGLKENAEVRIHLEGIIYYYLDKY